MAPSCLLVFHLFDAGGDACGGGRRARRKARSPKTADPQHLLRQGLLTRSRFRKAPIRNVFSFSGNDGCHAPFFNSSAKLGGPFSISPVNQNLIFYNCTKPLTEEVRQKSGLVETVCRNNTFVRAEGHYDDVSGRYSDYFLEGCNATVAPVLVGSGKTNASNYRELLSDGFLLTWQLPPLPPFELPPPAGKLTLVELVKSAW
ncbi:unnamed protein product [Urochloa humidicola]